jgi:hypothetical protein
VWLLSGRSGYIRRLVGFRSVTVTAADSAELACRRAAMPPYQGGGDMIRQVTFAKNTFKRRRVLIRVTGMSAWGPHRNNSLIEGSGHACRLRCLRPANRATSAYLQEAGPQRCQGDVGAVADVSGGPPQSERYHHTERHSRRAPWLDVVPVEGAELCQPPPLRVGGHSRRSEPVRAPRPHGRTCHFQ